MLYLCVGANMLYRDFAKMLYLDLAQILYRDIVKALYRSVGANRLYLHFVLRVHSSCFSEILSLNNLKLAC